MNVVPLAVHSPRAIEDVLRVHGWDSAVAADAAGGIHPAAFFVSGLAATALEALVLHGGKLGLNVVTGEDWAVIAGSQSRLSAFARPWVAPEPLAALAVQVGLALPVARPDVWRSARGGIAVDGPVLVGILNVTPDSFSDGGVLDSVDAAVAHGMRLAADGAAIIDVGGESTRPGRSASVAADLELSRILPVICQLVRAAPELLISVDTVKSEVARAALDAGAAIVNDVSGLRFDSEMAGVIARAGAGVILMHSRGEILELASYAHVDYPRGVVAEVLTELGSGLERAVSAGVPVDAIVLDPGLGFSKTVPQNMLLLDGLAALSALGRPVLVGPSRKRFLARRPDDAPGSRDAASATACALAWERGARLFRVHEVAGARDALALARSVVPF